MLAYLCCPAYGQVSTRTTASIVAAGFTPRIFRTTSSSLLAHGFNAAWCEALNLRKSEPITHFAMIHADIHAPADWLDELIAEQNKTQSDVLSCVVPIKSRSGLTSTGIMDVRSREVTRLSLKEVHGLPVTFGIKDTYIPNGVTENRNVWEHSRALAVNTGLWVCDFTQPWVEKVWFEIHDRIFRMPDGSFQQRTWPEDWNFSLQCHNLGLKVSATRCIKLHHVGDTEYPNYAVYGNDSESPRAGMCLNDKFWNDGKDILQDGRL